MIRSVSGDSTNMSRCQEAVDTRFGIRQNRFDGRGHSESYGTPTPVTVPLTVEKGPFIVISGHDLHDLKLLLEQTEGRGVNIYTHGEMLPAHGYPALKKYAHLKGNFGTAWQNQQKEFAALPAPVLFTTNCLMPPKASYADRVFTTSVVSYPELVHIGEEKDFTPVIEKALELGGYAQDTLLPGLNGGSTVTTGFARTAVLQHADEIEDGMLTGVTERTKIFKKGADAEYTEDGEHFFPLAGDTIVSMNLWGFSARVLDELWARMGAFLTEAMKTNPLKCEYFLPFVVNEQLADKSASVQVLPCEETWYGVTYREDLASVKEAVARMKAEGIYTEELWK